MSAVTMQEGTEVVDAKQSLIEQINAKKNQASEEANAIPKPEANEVDVGQQARNGEEMGGAQQEDEEAYRQEEQEKRLQFQVGDDTHEIDENARFEFKADGKTVNMSIAEMRDAAAGGIAVRNRMRQLAEEKKKLFTPFQGFSTLSSKDPLGALKKVFGAIKSVDENADLNNFLRDLGKQAQSLHSMSADERRAYELERDLDETRQTLTETERVAKIRSMQQDLMVERNLSEEQIFEYSNSILNNPELSENIRDEQDLFDRVGELAEEVDRQKAVRAALHKFDSKIKPNDPLVFELSSLLAKNPDFNQTDLEEIAEGVLAGMKRSRQSMNLTRKQKRGNTSGFSRKNQEALSPVESLKQQLLEKKKSQLN